MRSRLEILLDLLHAQPDAALATHSAAMPGYPFATSVAFATDEHHRPLLLISRLAEHTRNLAADNKASFLVSRALGGGEAARVSLLGQVVSVDPDERLMRRYLRFHPEAELFLKLGDFHFHRFEPRRILVVGGFAQAGWLDGQQLADARFIESEAEAELIDAVGSRLPAGCELLGVDPYGADIKERGARRRIVLPPGPLSAGSLLASLMSELP